MTRRSDALDDRAAQLLSRTCRTASPPGSRPPTAAAASARTPGRGPAAAAGARASSPTGRLFEKAGVEFSDVHGELRPEIARALPGEGDELPRHRRLAGAAPAQPARADGARQLPLPPARRPRGWFGGGADLTPYYPCREDVGPLPPHLASGLRRATTPAFYPRFKSWCDDYFFLPHRNEPRGVGGIFFDYLGAGAEATGGPGGRGAPSPREADPEAMFAFVRDVGDAFLRRLPADRRAPARRRRTASASGAGSCSAAAATSSSTCSTTAARCSACKTDGRVESILMSLPPVVRWEYGYAPEPGTPEAESLAAIVVEANWTGSSDSSLSRLRERVGVRASRLRSPAPGSTVTPLR